jgi:hypothetical protein
MKAQLDLINSEGKSDYAAQIERSGFALIENVINEGTADQLLAELENLKTDMACNRRAGKAFGIRNLLDVIPSARSLAESSILLSLVTPILGSGAKVVRGVYFDKHKDANWKVAWHQDLTIAVRHRIEVEGFGPWSLKAGIHHVQPPVPILENMLAVRIHLDESDESNGALRVMPGSHEHGRLDADTIQSWKRQGGIVTCPVKKGGVMLMRPLLLHASSAASNPRHRRVLHFEYSSSDLPCGIQWYDACGL